MDDDMTAAPGHRRLRILHLSDLHLRGPREPDRERRARVLGARWTANLAELRKDGAFDLVVLTGDVAFGGALDEYLELMRRTRDDGTITTWLDDSLAALGCTRAQIYLVPGNHDINRGVHPAAWRTVRDAWSSAGADDDAAFARWMVRGGAAPRGMAPQSRDRLLARQAAYRAWLAHGLGRPDLVPDPRRSYFGYRATIPAARLPFPVHVIGLDSAWLAGDDHDARKLRLTDDQILRLCTNSDGDHLTGLRLALVHHPLADLADGERARRLLQEHGIDLLLSGHLHESEVREIVTPDGQLRELATGCLYQHDRYRNAVTALTLDLDEAGRIRTLELRFRGWSERGHWHDDDGLYRGTRNGRLIVGDPGDPVGDVTAPAPERSPRPPPPPRRPPEVARRGRAHVILFLAANPSGTSRVALDEECAAIERELHMTTGRDDFEFRSKWAVSVDELQRHLNDLQPAIIHFSGPGGTTEAELRTDGSVAHRAAVTSGGIRLQGERREAQYVSARALSQMVHSATPSARLVVLNACFSDAVAEALCEVVDCVIGTRGAIGDDAARTFSVGFYRALGYRRSIGNAFAQAVAALAARQLPDEHTPVCRTRDGLDADHVRLPGLDRRPGP